MCFMCHDDVSAAPSACADCGAFELGADGFYDFSNAPALGATQMYGPGGEVIDLTSLSDYAWFEEGAEYEPCTISKEETLTMFEKYLSHARPVLVGPAQQPLHVHQVRSSGAIRGVLAGVRQRAAGLLHLLRGVRPDILRVQQEEEGGRRRKPPRRRRRRRFIQHPASSRLALERDDRRHRLARSTAVSGQLEVGPRARPTDDR